MLPSVLEHAHYKDLISAFIAQANEKGYKSKLAAAAGCKNSYLSQVLGGSVHITPEHAYGLAAFWRLSDVETEYFLLLVHCDRAGTKNLRKYFEDKLDRMRADATNLATTVFKDSHQMKNFELMSGYYANWHGAAIHVLLGIPGFQTVSAISKRLQLPETLVFRMLNLLQDLGLANQDAGQWKVLTYDIHLPKNSPLATPSHMSWRHRAIAANHNDSETSFQFTGINSVAASDIPKLQNILMKTVEDYRATTVPSAEEELVCLTMDFFRV